MLVRDAIPEDIDGIVAVLVAVAEEGRWIGTEAPVDVERRAERLGHLERDRHAAAR